MGETTEGIVVANDRFPQREGSRCDQSMSFVSQITCWDCDVI